MQVEDNKHHKILSLLQSKRFTEFIEQIQLEFNNIYIIINATTLLKEEAKIIADRIKKLLSQQYPLDIIHFSFIKNPKKVTQPIKKTIANIKHIIAVSSGKGGVGKSTLSVNLAHALSKSGLKVGLMDADLYGPSIHFMLQGKDINHKLNQLPLFVKHNIYYTSMAVLAKTEEAILLKAPMVIKILKQLLQDTPWPPLDILIIDLPPGTADINLHLALNYKLSGIIAICTPQQLALIDMLKSINMYQTMQVPILGLVENMSTFICPHCESISNIFDANRVEQLAQKKSLNFLGNIPIAIPLREYSDQHKLILNEEPQHLVSNRIKNIAQQVVELLNKL